MTKNEKETFIKRKVGFFYADDFQVEGIIKDVTSIGFIIEVTKSKKSFYEPGKEYFISANNFVCKFL